MRPQPRMQNKTSIRDSHHGHTGTTRHSPRNGFTAYFALSSVTTLFDTVACASSHRLDANDWGVGTTRLRRPRQHISLSALTASTASRPAFVTIASRPSCRNETVRISELIWVGRKQKYFCKRGLTPFRKIRSDLPVRQNQTDPVDKSRSARRSGWLVRRLPRGGGPRGPLVGSRLSRWLTHLAVQGLPHPAVNPARSPAQRDFKPCLAESLVESGKDVAVIPFAEHLVFPAPDQNVGLEQVIDASNDHGEPWFGCETTDGAASMGSVLTCEP